MWLIDIIVNLIKPKHMNTLKIPKMYKYNMIDIGEVVKIRKRKQKGDKLFNMEKDELIELLLQKEFEHREVSRLCMKLLGYKIVEEGDE